MIKGLGISEGIGIGNVYIIRDKKPDIISYTINDFEKEISRYDDAVVRFCKFTEEISRKAGENEAAILLGHCAIAQDPELRESVIYNIKSGLLNAEMAVENTFNKFIEIFQTMNDNILSERSQDIKDIKNKIHKILLGLPLTDYSDIPAGSVLVAEELTTSVTAMLDTKKIAGFITETGGKASHMAIIARIYEIPAVAGVKNILDVVKNGDAVILDGNSGEVYIYPDETTKISFLEKQRRQNDEKIELKRYKGLETKTKDGIKIEIFSNIGRAADIEDVLENDSEGIGLFRTEFLYMDSGHIPSEEEQFNVYKRAVMSMKRNGENKPVIIRTLDVGGDKEIDYLNLAKEENPFLGLRGIRCSLKNIEIFKSQIRAILRAGKFGDIRIMLPMISDIAEFRRAKEHIDDVKKELEREGMDFYAGIKTGMMIETPSAAVSADVFAKEADFFSIGTNDLTQYTMAADRGNENVSYLYTHYSPAVMKLIGLAIEAANNNQIPVGMCGEAAADPLMIPYLVAMGINELSVSPPNVLKVRKMINNLNTENIKPYLKIIQELSSADEVREYLLNLGQ